jgi:hypothetical protein
MGKVYLEINRLYVFISTLRKEGDEFHCDVFDELALDDLEVCRGGIFNPSAIYVFVGKFLSKNNLIGSKAVICCPYLAGCSKVRKELGCLQVMLCVCKAGLVVEAMFDEWVLRGKPFVSKEKHEALFSRKGSEHQN